PAFKDHLFAISSVSGGSLGAAIFTAALRTVEREQGHAQAKVQVGQPAPAEDLAGTAAPAVLKTNPCPAISAFLEAKPGAVPADIQAGPHEKAVQGMLRHDLLSPLIGATLFTDFTQRFLPQPFGELDRARALEASFEAAASPTGKANSGPLAESFLEH